MALTLEQINEKIDALNTKATELQAAVEAGDSDKSVTEVKALLDDDIVPQVKALTEEKLAAEAVEERKAMGTAITTLQSELEELRKPAGGFTIAPGGKGLEENENPYADGKYSQWADIKAANKGVQAARERLEAGAKALDYADSYSFNEEGKAVMTEGTESRGGYLVQPLLERQLVLAREKDNVIRGLVSSLNVTTNAIQLDQLGLATEAGWVAELAEKPEGNTFKLASVTANVYTAAGLARISNQLLQDSNPAVDQLITQDLAKRLVALEESSFLFGTGNNQPLGILETPGVGAVNLENSADPADEGGLLDSILNSIAEVQQNWGQPSAMVMHPRTWTAILKSRDSVGHYTISPRNIFGAGYDPETTRTYIDGPQQTLFGVEVVLSNRVPTNTGAGKNQSRVIVGDFKEAIILDRQGITIDESEHVYFTTNATVFRAEIRVGFTAARSPLAFSVIGGTGLANR